MNTPKSFSCTQELLQQLTESYFGQQFTDTRAKKFFCELVVDFVVEEITLQMICYRCKNAVRMFFVRSGKEVFVYIQDRVQPIIQLHFRFSFPRISQRCVEREYFQGSVNNIIGRLYFTYRGNADGPFFDSFQIQILTGKTEYLCTDKNANFLVNLLDEWTLPETTLTPAEAYVKCRNVHCNVGFTDDRVCLH